MAAHHLSPYTGPPPEEGGVSPFEAIKHIDSDGEHWLARELMPLMGYPGYRRNFDAVIAKAKEACRNSGDVVEDHFGDAARMVPIGSGAVRQVPDVRLTRHACYLVAQNGDSRKPEVAAAMTYFAVMTQRAELAASQGLSVVEPDFDTLDDNTLTYMDRLAQMLAKAVNAVRIERKKVAELAPAAALAETYAAADGVATKRSFARTVIQNAEAKSIKVTDRQVYDFLGHLGLIVRAKTSEYGQATASAIRGGLAVNETSVLPPEGRRLRPKKVTWGKLTAKGEDYAFRRVYATLDRYGTLDLKKIRDDV